MSTARRANTTGDAESGDAANRRRTSARGGQPCTHAPPADRKYLADHDPARAASHEAIKSLTIESTILPKAAPMITPTARSTTLPGSLHLRHSILRRKMSLPKLSSLSPARAYPGPSWVWISMLTKTYTP